MKSTIQRLTLLGIVGVIALVVSAVSIQADSNSTRHRLINRDAPGQQIEIAKYVVPGKINVFDFYSKYCGPCMAIAPYLEKLAGKRADVVVNKVDINRPAVAGIDWSSPVVRQYGLQSVPHFVIYDASGKKTAEGESAYRKVMEMIRANEH